MLTEQNLCLNQGKADASCAACDCGFETGWFGGKCHCRYIILTLKVKMATFEWLAKNRSVARFQTTFSEDIAAAVP
jgi:hypothetical protein